MQYASFAARFKKYFIGILRCVVVCVGPCAAASHAVDEGVKIDVDGTVHIPAHSVPVSEFLSESGKQYLTEHLQNMQKPELLVQDNGVPGLLKPYLERQREIFPLKLEDAKIGGVHTVVYTPLPGINKKNQNKVLINLHGGGFSGCWPACSELESRPIAALAGIKVVSIDYRQGPKYQFPAASEDVEAVYRALLKQYPPNNIGIYGCSAGGMLTGMSVAWLQKQSLPLPAAVGVLCAGMTVAANGFGGDAAYTVMATGEAMVPPPPLPENYTGKSPLSYLANANLNDPLVSPARSAEVLAKFPPTLLITGTRAFELSSAVYTHAQLIKQGVDARLHVWDGMFHGFLYNPDVPESKESYAVIVKFFDENLGE